ncbi:MAG TPA: hypothetical protein DDY87_00205 [Clostridiales bacterium]|nr:hypothetical protein [Clostridiales bacterium]
MKKRNRVAFFNIFSTVLLNGISIITGPLFSRLLGDSGYGALKIYNIWVSILTVVFTLQTQATLVNARVEYPEAEQKRYQSAAMGLSVLTFSVCAGFVLIFLSPIARILQLDRALVCLMLLQAFGTFCVNFLHIKNVYEYRAGWNLLLSLTVSIVPLLLAVALVLRLPPDIRYYGRVVANAAAYGVLGLPICAWILLRGRTVYRKDYWKFCVFLAVPAVFHNLTDLILGQSDQLMLQHMVDLATVGHYSSALTLSNFLFVLFGALNNTWCPFFFDEFKQGKLDAVLGKSRNFLEVFTVLSCGFLLLAPEVYHVYVPSAYWDATKLIPLFVAGYYLNFLCTFPVNFEYYHKKPKVTAGVTIASSLVNVVLNYLFILKIGMAGAAVATLISHGVQLALHYGYCRFLLGRKDYPFPVKLWLSYTLIFAAVAALVLLTPNLWLPRWSVGAVIGIFELLRIRRRKVLI